MIGQLLHILKKSSPINPVRFIETNTERKKPYFLQEMVRVPEYQVHAVFHFLHEGAASFDEV